LLALSSTSSKKLAILAAKKSAGHLGFLEMRLRGMKKGTTELCSSCFIVCTAAVGVGADATKEEVVELTEQALELVLELTEAALKLTEELELMREVVELMEEVVELMEGAVELMREVWVTKGLASSRSVISSPESLS
jgi:hypothetical protein